MSKKIVKVPRASVFMLKKADERKEQPWVYLEREMKEMAEKGIKPYNQKVGDWLAYLKDLKQHFRNEHKENFRKLKEDRGPPWYIQFSPHNLEITANLAKCFRKDKLFRSYNCSIGALRKLGITTKYPQSIIVAALKHSAEDPGLFMWTLFSLYYKQPPSQPLPKYDLNAKLLMSAIVFIDLQECIKELTRLTAYAPPPNPAHKKRKPHVIPDCKFGEYLEKPYSLPCHPKPPKKKPGFNYNPKIWEDKSFEKLAEKSSHISLKKRRQRIEDQKPHVAECKYKFWEAPLSVRIVNPEEIEYINMLKMFKVKPKLAVKPPQENIQCHIGTVTYSGNKPQYQLHSFTSIPTGYIIHNGGLVKTEQDVVTHILDYIKYPRHTLTSCESSCNCLEKWSVARNHIKDSKCKCGHRYDFYNEPSGKPMRKYFKPPTKHKPYELDAASIADLDSKNYLIKSLIDGALEAEYRNAHTETPDIYTMPPKVILQSLMGDLMETSLLLTHLPKAFLLPNLQAWVRRRIKGRIGQKLKDQLQIKSKRAWLHIDHTDFRVRAHRIPYTQKTMPKYDYSHRNLMQNLREREFRKLANKCKRIQLLRSHIFWPTMRYDDFPNKNFLHSYCAYMPQPEKPLHIYHPPKIASAKQNKTCPLIF